MGLLRVGLGLRQDPGRLSSCVISEKKRIRRETRLWAHTSVSGSKLNVAIDFYWAFSQKWLGLNRSRWQRIPMAPSRVKLSHWDNLFLKSQALRLFHGQPERVPGGTIPRKSLPDTHLNVAPFSGVRTRLLSQLVACLL